MFMVEGWPLLFKMSLGVLLEMRPLLEVRPHTTATMLLTYNVVDFHLKACRLVWERRVGEMFCLL